MKDRIADLLKKAGAVIACGAGSPREVAQFVFSSNEPTNAQRVSVSRWLNGKARPDGQSALAILEWLSAKTLEINAASDDVKAAYRKAME